MSEVKQKEGEFDIWVVGDMYEEIRPRFLELFGTINNGEYLIARLPAYGNTFSIPL